MPFRLLALGLLAIHLAAASPGSAPAAAPADTPRIVAPEAFFGHRIGADGKLARWDRMLEYFRTVDAASDRVQLRELGSSTEGRPFVALEISAPDTLAHRDEYRRLQRRLYFQDGDPTDAERDELFQRGKAVVVVTCSMHATEVGATQMTLELVHHLATDNSDRTRHVLDNVILILVPSLNPDGQVMVVDWYNRNAGTPHDASPLPWLYHPYVGHDNNRDMYMFTQVESRLMAHLLWHDWFPAVWLDEHQQGAGGARMFVMPATDPINPNVHPLVYRWNGIFGQRQAAALEAAGKTGIIYNSTYTNFWQGAMAWSGWWHNQIGLLTEAASARLATPTEQLRAEVGQSAPPVSTDDAAAQNRRQLERPTDPLPAPRDVTPRTEYPSPWLGGRWSLRDIVDYDFIATMALLESAADQRDTLLRHVFEINRSTIHAGRRGNPAAILIRRDTSHDPGAAARLVERLQIGGVAVSRATAAFEAGGTTYPAGTFVVPMAQVFSRFAKDLLERQTYPDVRRAPGAAPESPYDVTAWSLGLLIGADVVFVDRPLAADAPLERLNGSPHEQVPVPARAQRYTFAYRGPTAVRAVNRLLASGARVSLVRAGSSVTAEVDGARRADLDTLAHDGVIITPASTRRRPDAWPLALPRIGLYQPWTANMDEGWTRWVLEQHGFPFTTLRNADVQRGGLRDRFDVVLFADQSVSSILRGNDATSIRSEFRGGIGDVGLEALRTYIAEGGSIIMLGAATDLAIEKFGVPVRNLKKDLSREQHLAPGTIVRLEVDRASAIGTGMPAETCGFYNNNPFFTVLDGFTSRPATVVVRYPNSGILASGWLKGEHLMAGRAAVVTVDMKPGRLVLFGIRPQFRAQTQATFPLLFNALYDTAR